MKGASTNASILLDASIKLIGSVGGGVVLSSRDPSLGYVGAGADSCEGGGGGVSSRYVLSEDGTIMSCDCGGGGIVIVLCGGGYSWPSCGGCMVLCGECSSPSRGGGGVE